MWLYKLQYQQKKKSLLNVKFSLRIQVSIHSGCFTSFLSLTSRLKCQLKLYLQSLTLDFYGTVKVTFEFPFHQLKEKQPQTLDILDTGIKTVYCLQVS